MVSDFLWHNIVVQCKVTSHYDCNKLIFLVIYCKYRCTNASTARNDATHLHQFVEAVNPVHHSLLKVTSERDVGHMTSQALNPSLHCIFRHISTPVVITTIITILGEDINITYLQTR